MSGSESKMEGGESTKVPDMLGCPECKELMKNATKLPCCETSLCRPCAYKKLVMNKKKCWFSKTDKCSEPLQLNQLSPDLELRELIQDYLEGGTKYKENESKTEDRSTPEYIDCVDVSLPLRPNIVVKTESISQPEDEEYSEFGNTSLDQTQIKTELPLETSFNVPPTPPGGSDLMAPMADQEEYSELPPGGSPATINLKKETCMEWSNESGVDLKTENLVDDLKKESGLEDDLFLPHPYTLPNTPSSIRTEHQGSGYWSDDTYSGSFFGKLQWDLTEPSKGYINCWDGGELRKAHVSRLEVKCGAESGDLVEFTLRSHPEHGKVARRVKLVEKGIPDTDEDQIRSQENLKRSLELSAGLHDSNKKIKTDDDIIDAANELESMSNSYHDIAADDELTFSWHQTIVKSENEFVPIDEEPVSSECICNTSNLKRCGLCPVYFLKSESQHTILEGESVTLVARIEGAENQKLDYVRHLPFPFLFPHGSPDFSLLTTLGSQCIVKKVSPVFNGGYVYVSVRNDTAYQVNISPGNILGVCQSHVAKESEISPNFIMEPPDRQNVGVIPIMVKRRDFSRPEKNNHVCGFAEIGYDDMNYEYCLVKIGLLPEFEPKFGLLKDEMTVQVKRNVWLELIPKGKGYENLLPKYGIIGQAMCIMNERHVKDSLLAQIPEIANDQSESKMSKTEDEMEKSDPYESMVMKLDMDIGTGPAASDGESAGPKLNLLDKTFRGVTNEAITILPESERSVDLFLNSDDDFDPKNLLKMQVDITNNEEFKYYNNCYNILPQVCTVVNAKCKQTNTQLPSVKVTILNQRKEVACLPINASIALVRVQRATNKEVATRSASAKEQGATQEQQSVQPEKPKKVPAAFKKLERLKRRCLQKWDELLEDDPWNNTLLVEEKYPYFTANPKPRIPFGLKLNSLLMRVAVNQSSKPVKVLDKIKGVFNCTICDRLIFDKYVLQDHIYSDSHKANLKTMQVVAGIEERLYMNRPVIQELLDQFQDQEVALLGLDHLFEVINTADRSALYHCALCNSDTDLRSILLHLISPSHVFNFLKEFFPLAWARFAGAQDVDRWTDLDYECFTKVISKINAVYGQRKPSIVAGEEKLDECLENLSDSLYPPNKSEIDTFFKTLKQNDVAAEVGVTASKPKIRTISRFVVTVDNRKIPPGALDRVPCKITNVSHTRNIEGKFVLVAKHPSNSYCDIRPGLSRVFMKDTTPMVHVCVHNPLPDQALDLEINQQIATVKWKK